MTTWTDRRTHLRRAAALGIAAALTLALGACASDAGDENADPNAISGDLTMLTPIFEGSAGQKLLEDELLPQFTAMYPDVHVSVDYTNYARLNEKLTTGVVAGLVPDVMMMGVGWIEAFADRGVLANLTDGGLTPESLEATMTPQIVEAGLWKGDVYGVPIMLDARFGVARMDLLREAGYDAPPKTWDELVEMSKALTERDAKGKLTRTGFDMLTIEPRQMFETTMFSNGADLFTDDNSSPAFDSKEGVEALARIVDLFHTDKVEDTGFSAPNATVNPLINGRAAMAIAHNNVWTQAQAADPEIVQYLEPFLIPGDAPSMFVGGTMAAVSATSKHEKAAQKLVEFLASPGPALAANQQRGNVPALTELLDSDYVSDNRLVQFAMENLPVAKREGGPPKWLGLRGDVAPAIENAILRKKTPKAALSDLADTFQKKLDR
ncbi:MULTISPECIES: extracellular solute-binding protein [unclassified Plantibacter]|jgi:multiple sugar transport system substrate-binding protein|uniref:extracellular solute-binding protein n=1 Tax=unclassified Plantibacter TaxID=2624265 RepID=UPI003D344EF0